MKGGDFTADNEIIPCWIKRALSYLVIAGAAFIVIGIVCPIHFYALIPIQQQMDGLCFRLLDKQTEYIHMPEESMTNLIEESMLNDNDTYRRLLSIIKSKIWIEEEYIEYIALAMVFIPIYVCILHKLRVKSKKKESIATSTIFNQLRLIVIYIMIGFMLLCIARSIEYFINKQINIGKIEDYVIEHFYNNFDTDNMEYLEMYIASEESPDLERLDAYAIYFFYYDIKDKDSLDFFNECRAIEVHISREGEIILWDQFSWPWVPAEGYYRAGEKLVKKLI